jgi:hypothetical protein
MLLSPSIRSATSGVSVQGNWRQTFLQLALLPIIIVGQNVQAAAADRRAEDTYKDAEAVLHEAIEIQKHLEAQDIVLERLIAVATGKP